ncbi:VIT and vWA domain-containing protein [Ottowia testudinis]|uniref:VWA domain-containing protein n=1 Tax=Ottowia testudinis TaxID=2816950 RepID=A0A975CGR1_9BURK|nr:VIT and VWA domain-containing protein [Ottowia testudinis]QTD45477.1 VWA domain-containing protein [Ottowia testudinis]
MRADTLTDTFTALRELPRAVLHSVAPAVPSPLRHVVRTGQRAGVLAQRVAWYSLLSALVLLAPPSRAQATADAAKAESPYFFVKGAQPGVDALPLKSTDVQVNISGVIADVVVTQRYKNEGTVPIEAKYIFPGSTRAAVNGLNVRIAGRLVVAQIREKRQAQVEYDQAKKEGKTAALLEQHRPNVFQMNVANILPGEDVAVELRYNELLVPTDGNYQFVFPTVVGPRYAGTASKAPSETTSGQTAAHAQAFPAQPVLRAGEVSPAAFNLKVNMASPIGIQEIRSPSHAIDTQMDAGSAAKRASVQLAGSASRVANNRDFILDYRLAGSAIQSGVLLHKGEKENFFLAMVQPPKAVPQAAITPRDYIFVVDISGSMHGFPLDTAKALMRQLLGNLKASDTFNVLLFSGSNRFLAPHSVPATPANINAAIRTIDEMGGGGSTELLPALRRVYAEPKPQELSRTVVVVTDGYVTVESEAFALVRKHLGQANVFAFGIGSSVNRHLMEGLARAGMGEPFIVTQPAEAKAQAERFRKLIESPVLTSVKAKFEGIDVYDVEPQALPDVLAERPVIVFGKWRDKAGGNGATPRVLIEGRAASGPYTQALPMDTQAEWSGTGALRHLWARHRIAALSDEEALTGGDAQKAAITQLGLDYSLLTQYTSFIAVDKVVRNPGGQGATANQPSPLPEGVSNLAVGEASALGAAVSSTPEPETWAAMLVVLAVLGAQVARRQRRGMFTA